MSSCGAVIKRDHGSRNVILVVAAHPDDEVLGCGGTIARHAAAGDSVRILILAEGATSRDLRRDPQRRSSEIEELRDAGRAAARILGANAPQYAGLPDNRLDSVALIDVVKIIESAASEFKPSVIYTHHSGDLNVDHQIVHRAVMTACRPLPGSNLQAIYAFETVSSTEWGLAGLANAFNPTRFVNIADFLDRKVEALKCYSQEIRPFPHARSIENIRALATMRGASVGVDAAEAFVVVREIS